MFSQITLPAIIAAGIIDSINPCAIGVLIFLLTYLVALKNKKLVIAVGLTYILTVYIVYFAAGIGLLTAIASFSVTVFIYYFSGALLILLGLITIFSLIKKDSEPVLKIPESAKPTIEKWVKKASVPAAMVLGAVVSAFELPCTGGIYLAILALLGQMGLTLKPVLYLLLYNFFFILPLIVIWLLILFASSSEKIKLWFSKNKTFLRIIMGVGMIVLGIFIVFNII